MKNKGILLPIDYSNAIDLDSIDVFTKGIILVYKENQHAGYIIYSNDDEFWYFSRRINYINSIESKESLVDLMNQIITSELGDDFELIEFK